MLKQIPKKARFDMFVSEETNRGLKTFIWNKTGDIKQGDISKWIENAIINLIQNDNKVNSGPARSTRTSNQTPQRPNQGDLII
jgi:hypothetical protein